MNNISICAVFKEETQWLKEWLEWHLLVGIEHFYLFLHDTGEEQEIVIQKLNYYSDKEITYIPFHNYQSGDFQIVAYDTCLKNYGNQTKWLGFIDLDEFVFPVDPSLTLSEILSKYEENSIKGLNASVCTFGDSGHRFSPTLQTRDLIWRAFDFRPCNYTAKQFFRTEYLKNYIYGGYWDQLVNEDYKLSKTIKQPRPANLIRVNHYPVRSQYDFWNKKMRRGWPANLEKHKLTHRDWENKYKMLNHNDVMDKSAHRFLPGLKAVFDWIHD